MDIDKECSALGGLFQKIINDMKTSSPVWEDFLLKATKLHTALRGTITAAGAFLETFQKVADAATNTQGATREIGSALTRLCMRHRSIESKLKEFTQSIMELMVTPMQDKMDDWKKTSVHLDKEHAKEYKKARQEIKRASSDTMRLQKKVKKGKHDMQLRLDHAMQDVNDKYLLLEEAEKSSVRTALIEERGRFCTFVSCLKPVVDQEIAMLTEVTHLQEIVEQLCMIAGDPTQLPEASEQLLQDVKTTEGTSFTFQTPPSSPSSLGSRKSSMCSINSINSSSSGSSKSHSPCHQLRHHRNSAQALTPGAIRLSSVSSQDSGFTSQDTLYPRPHTPQPTTNRQSSLVETSNTSLASSTSSGVNQSASATDITSANSSEGINNANNSTDTANTSLSGTWASWTASTDLGGLERPHTISTAYERSHARPALTAHTFEAPPPTTSQTAPATPNPYAVPCLVPEGNKSDPNVSSKPTSKIYERSASVGAAPSTPTTAKKARSVVATPVVAPTVPDFIMTHQDQIIPQPVYVNMNELATMAAQKHKEVEMRRKQGVALPQGSPNMGGAEQRPPDGRASIAGIPGSPATVAAQQLAHRNQRSMSMPAAPEDMSPLSEALEGLNSEMKSGQHIIQSKYQAPNSMELAAAIKDLEASTAALQMTYENKPPNDEDEGDDNEENEEVLTPNATDLEPCYAIPTTLPPDTMPPHSSTTFTQPEYSSESSTFTQPPLNDSSHDQISSAPNTVTGAPSHTPSHASQSDSNTPYHVTFTNSTPNHVTFASPAPSESSTDDLDDLPLPPPPDVYDSLPATTAPPGVDMATTHTSPTNNVSPSSNPQCAENSVYPTESQCVENSVASTDQQCIDNSSSVELTNSSHTQGASQGVTIPQGATQGVTIPQGALQGAVPAFVTPLRRPMSMAGSLRRSSMHKPSPPVRRNSSLGGMMPSSALIQAAASIQPTNPPRSGSNTPTPQPSPSSTPRAQHPTQGQQNVAPGQQNMAPGQQSPVPGQMGGVINLNSLMQNQNEVIYMQPHFHLQQQQQQQQQGPTTAQHYQTTSTAPGSHYQAAQPQYQHPNQQPNQQTQHYHPGQPHYQAAQPNNHQPQQQQHYHTGQQQQIPQSGYQQQQQQQTIYQQSTVNNPHPYHPPQQNGTSEPPPAPAPAPGPQEEVGGGFWPPPPPPVQESDYAELDTIQMQIHDVSSGSQRPSSIGHIQSTHGSIIQSLNAKLSAAPNHIPGAPANMNNGNNDCGVYGGNQTNMMNSTLSYSSDDVTPTAEPPRDAIMHQHIKQ